jgi:hypothetical protein
MYRDHGENTGLPSIESHFEEMPGKFKRRNGIGFIFKP